MIPLVSLPLKTKGSLSQITPKRLNYLMNSSAQFSPMKICLPYLRPFPACFQQFLILSLSLMALKSCSRIFRQIKRLVLTELHHVFLKRRLLKLPPYYPSFSRDLLIQASSQVIGNLLTSLRYIRRVSVPNPVIIGQCRSLRYVASCWNMLSIHI